MEKARIMWKKSKYQKPLQKKRDENSSVMFFCVYVWENPPEYMNHGALVYRVFNLRRLPAIIMMIFRS